jgi:hypothetical protein
MSYNIIWKKIQQCKGKEPWVYFYVYNIIELVLSLQIALVFHFINNKKCLFFKSKNRTHLKKIVTFHLQMIVCENVNLPHIYN